MFFTPKIIKSIIEYWVKLKSSSRYIRQKSIPVNPTSRQLWSPVKIPLNRFVPVMVWSVVKSIYFPLLNPNVVRCVLSVGVIFEIGAFVLNVDCPFEIKLLDIVVDVLEIVKGVVEFVKLSFVIKLIVELGVLLLGVKNKSLFTTSTLTFFVDGIVSYNIKLPDIEASPAIFTLVLFMTKGLYVVISLIVKM